MYKSHKPILKSSTPRESVEFKFSKFQALQVPKGWDRLLVSLVSVETGKVLARLGKAPVRNGTCQWTESHTESVSVSQIESEESLIKLLVSTGTTRSSVLGEVIVNLAHDTNSKVSALVSHPLNKCSYGTILQVKIQCLTPKSKFRSEDPKHSSFEDKDQDVDNLDPGSQSNGSNHSSDGANGPLEEESAPNFPRLLKPESKVISRSASGPYYSFDSAEIEMRKKDLLSSRNELKTNENNHGGKQVEGSYEGSPPPENLSVADSLSSQSSPVSHFYIGDDSQNQALATKPSLKIIGSSKNLLEAAEDAIEELRAEAKMWERNARKLVIDLDVSKKEFSEQSKKQAELVMELSSAHSERDGLKREIEVLKTELQEARAKCAQEDLRIQSESLIQVQNILENEIKHQQNLNANIGEQLKRSQESNIQLVSVLQELEETIEQQKAEIERLSSLKSNLGDLESSIAKASENNKTLLLQLQELQASEEKLQADVLVLDKALKDRTNELENSQKSNSKIMSNLENDYKSQISLKEEEIARLEANLSRSVNNADCMDLMQEVESLRGKVQELENDCTELTEENLELLLKLKELNKSGIRKSPSFGSVSSDHQNICPSDDSDVTDPKSQICNYLEEVPNSCFEGSEQFIEIMKQLEIAFNLLMKSWYNISSEGSEERKNFLQYFKSSSADKAMTIANVCSCLLDLNTLLELRISEFEDVIQGHELEIQERNALISEAEKKMEDEIQRHQKSKEKIEETCADLLKELDEKKLQMDYIEGNLRSKEEENKLLVCYQRELEAKIAELQQQTGHLEQDLKVVSSERDMKSKYSKNLENDITILRNSLDSHVSTKTKLERNLEEFQRERDELEHNIQSLQEENFQFQDCISSLEDEIRHLKEEKELFQNETDKSKSVAMSLQKEIEKLRVEFDCQISSLHKKSEHMQKQWLEAQKDCEDLKADNQSLRASAGTYKQELMELQNSNSELIRENQEVKDQCSEMAAQLSNSKESLSDCTKNVENLEDHLCLLIDDFARRENCLKSEVDTLVQEIRNHEDKLVLYETSHKELSAKMLTIENLQNEVEHLTKQISNANEEKKRLSSDADGEVSQLLADKAELQCSLQEFESKFKVLNGRLAASQKSYDILQADNERVLISLANYKKNEEKVKTDINDLELKLTISDYERQQLTKEMSILKVQLQHVSVLRDEILTLKGDLQESLLEKGKLELAVQKLTGEYEEIKAENALLSEEITSFQAAASEYEESERKKLAFEEKIKKMESELTAKKILCTQNSHLKDELAESKRANSQFQQKIFLLEEEKDEWFKKAQALEKELELMMRRYNYKEKTKEDHFYDESPLAVSVDPATKMQLHESEPSEALDANTQNRVKKNSRLISTSQNDYAVFSEKSATDDDRTMTRRKYERTKSSLETELRDLRERYLEMSLKYAEVEAQREDLVMKLKASNNAKRWFS